MYTVQSMIRACLYQQLSLPYMDLGLTQAAGAVSQRAVTLPCFQHLSTVLCTLQVFVWEDADEDVVETYKTYEGHQEDVLSMAAYTRKQLLATGQHMCGWTLRARQQMEPFETPLNRAGMVLEMAINSACLHCNFGI